jgi:two-component system LytT family response regulator
MIRTLIIEDESRAAELLRQMLEEIDADITVVEVCGDLPSAVKAIKKHSPELVFLDVELPVYNGLQLLEFLNVDEINFRIIFTTASHQHALRAFDMSAVDYVLKPLQFEKLKTAVEKFKEGRTQKSNYPYATLRDNFFHNGKKKIVLPVISGFEIIALDEILFIKAEGSYAKIHRSEGGNLLASHNLKYFEDMFQGENNFIRIHRSYLVNVDYAKKILRTEGPILVMDNKSELPISNEKIDEVLAYFNFHKKG